MNIKICEVPGIVPLVPLKIEYTEYEYSREQRMLEDYALYEDCSGLFFGAEGHGKLWEQPRYVYDKEKLWSVNPDFTGPMPDDTSENSGYTRHDGKYIIPRFCLHADRQGWRKKNELATRRFIGYRDFEILLAGTGDGGGRNAAIILGRKIGEALKKIGTNTVEIEFTKYFGFLGPYTNEYYTQKDFDILVPLLKGDTQPMQRFLDQTESPPEKASGIDAAWEERTDVVVEETKLEQEKTDMAWVTKQDILTDFDIAENDLQAQIAGLRDTGQIDFDWYRENSSVVGVTDFLTQEQVEVLRGLIFAEVEENEGVEEETEAPVGGGPLPELDYKNPFQKERVNYATGIEPEPIPEAVSDPGPVALNPLQKEQMGYDAGVEPEPETIPVPSGLPPYPPEEQGAPEDDQETSPPSAVATIRAADEDIANAMEQIDSLNAEIGESQKRKQGAALDVQRAINLFGGSLLAEDGDIGPVSVDAIKAKRAELDELLAFFE